MAKQNSSGLPIPILYSFGGKSGIKSDVDPRNIKQGDLLVRGAYSGSVNMRNMGEGLNVSPGYETVEGNTFQYVPDAPVVQNKKWRIYIDLSAVPTLTTADVVQNGDFASASFWTTGTGWAIGAGLATHTPGASGFISQSIDVPEGDFDIEFTISGRTAGTLTLLVDGVTINTYSSNATFTVTANSNSRPLLIEFLANSAFDGSIDNVSATQSGYNYVFDYSLETPSQTVLQSGTNEHIVFTNNIFTSLSNIEAYILAEFSFGTPSATSEVTGAYTGYVEFEFAIAPSFNYQLEFTELTTNGIVLSLVVSQEPVDVSMVGEWNLIGSCDRTGDCFQFFTTRNVLPSEIEILNVVNSGGRIQIETLTPHGMVEGQSCRIEGVIGVPEANGDWIIEGVSPYIFDLTLSSFIGPAYISGGVVTKNIYGLGEIGVVVKNDLNENVYTRLLRSLEFNFTTLKQIDVRVKRKQDENKAAYFTDNYNVPRVFYYKGDYITDGAINIFNSENIYDYGNINAELSWLINNENFNVTFERQDQIGGQLKSGNWRYAARLLTENFTESNWSQLTDIVSVYSDNENSPSIIGNNPDVTTSKVNVLKITNRTEGIYKYVEIAALNYINNLVPYGYIIGRYVLSDEEDIYISHTGNETNIDLDVGTINDVTAKFVTAQNIELIDNRAVLSNLTPVQVLDFSDWVRTFQYSLERYEIDNVTGYWLSTGGANNGEYQIVDNIYSYKSHMMLETYRYGFRFKLKNGSITDVFYPGYDIRIDLPSTLPSERIAGSFTSFDITSQSGGGIPDFVYSIYINWQNINLDYLIDGIPANQLIDEIIPCRATVIPEVLLSGNIAIGVTNNSGDADEANAPSANAAYIIPYPYISDDINITSDVYPGTTSGGGASFSQARQSAFLYAPDNYFGLSDLSPQSGDQLYVFGNPTRFGSFPAGFAPTEVFNDSHYSEYDGYSNITTNPTSYTFVSGNAVQSALNPKRINNGFGGAWTIPAPFVLDSLTHYNAHQLGSGGTGATDGLNVRLCEKAVIIRSASQITNVGGNTDYGFYRAVYYRPLTNKYGNPETTIYTEFLEPLYVSGRNGYIGSGELVSFGDVFNQKSYLKFRYPAHYQLSTLYWLGWGIGVGFYSQNRNNIQLRCYATETDSLGYRIPAYGWRNWVSFGWTNDSDPLAFRTIASNLYVNAQGKDNQLFYNFGYTPINGVVTVAAYNENISNQYQKDWGNAISWSDIESDGAVTDNLRNFPPLNLKFLDYTDGSITDARSLNGELITIQPRAVIRQYFNTTAIVNTQDGGEAQLGTGAVLSRRGSVMNKYGSQNKWSVVVGLSDMGHDVLYAVDTRNKVAWRMGYNGTNALEEVNGMKSFFANYLDWVRTVDTPAHGEGICSVANQRFKEVIWTMRGQKPVEEWTDRETEVTLINFNNLYGNQVLSNSEFNGGITGWESLDGVYAPDPTVWQWNSGAGGYAFIAPGDTGFIAQENPITLNLATTYQIVIDVLSINGADDLEVSFQNGGPTEFTISTAGVHYLTYTAQSGDDNIYLYFTSAAGPGQVACSVKSVSVREIISATNWDGSGDWLIANNRADTIGNVTTNLVEDVPNYIVANDAYQLDFNVSNYVGGDLRVRIGNTASAFLSISGDGSYSVNITPTGTGVVSFEPAGGGYEGGLTGTIRLTRISTKTYVQGDVVSVPGITTYEGFPDLYEVVVPSTGGSLPTPFNPDYQLIPHTDPRYYNEYTIVFDEFKDEWSMFLTPKPKIYAKFLDSYFLPKPVSDVGRIYLADDGLWTSWFDGTQSAEAFIDPVINQPTGRKRFLAARVESDIAPERMEVITENGTNITPSSDFVQREGAEFDGFVKSEVSTDSISWGDYGIFRLVVRQGTYNKINSFIAKVRQRARAYFS